MFLFRVDVCCKTIAAKRPTKIKSRGLKKNQFVHRRKNHYTLTSLTHSTRHAHDTSDNSIQQSSQHTPYRFGLPCSFRCAVPSVDPSCLGAVAVYFLYYLPLRTARHGDAATALTCELHYAFPQCYQSIFFYLA